MMEYQFDRELEALRIRINAEGQLPYGRYIKPNYGTIQPLVIQMRSIVNVLRPDWKNKQKKALRLGMLALWTQQKVGSTYDLTAYQCSTILSFIEPDGSEEAGDRTWQFLEDSAAAVEAGSLSQASFD